MSMTRRCIPILILLVPMVAIRPQSAGAQDSVTVRAINEIPRRNIRWLTTAAADLTEGDIRELLVSPFDGDTVLVTAVMMTDPRNSAASEIIQNRVARIHFFVRDVAAVSDGSGGNGIQVIDSNWDQHDLLGLGVADVIRLTAIVSEFQGAPVLRPLAVERIGFYEDLGYPLNMLAANGGIAAHDLNRSMGSGRFQAVWQALPVLHGEYVCFDRAFVVRALPEPHEGRVNWAVSTTPSGPPVYVFDTSHRFRSDRKTEYPPEFNVRSDDFTPPPLGSTVRICGFVVLQAFNDPDGIGFPTTASTGNMLSLTPFRDSDLTILELPPEITAVSRPNYVHGPRVAFLTNADVFADPAREVQSVFLTSIVGSDTLTRPMYKRTLVEWSESIPPAGRDGAVVRYFVEARDDAGIRVRSDIQQFRTLENGIRSIADIQSTFDLREGESPFSGLRLPVDITARIQSDPSSSGLFTVQDDTARTSWSGIELDPATSAGRGLDRGDVIRISSARIEEVANSTRLSSVEFAIIDQEGAPIPHLPVSSYDLTLPETAESFEGMALRIEPATVIHDWENGEWSISNGSLSDTVRVSSMSPLIDQAALTRWETRPYIQGIWLQDGNRWLLVPESPSDIGEIVNVAREADGIPADDAGMVRAVFPNPFKRTMRVEMEVSSTSQTRVELFDLAGRSVGVIADEVLHAGHHAFVVSGADLPAGRYFVKVETPTHVSTFTVIHVD